MTFTELAEYVIADLRADGDSFITIPSAAPYFSEPFGIRLATYLSNFTMETLLLYSSAEEITIQSGDREFSFADSANCAKHFFDVTTIFIESYPLPKCRHVQDILNWWNPAITAGTPSRWAQLDKSKILFDVEWASAPSDTYAAGFYRHPAIEDDDQVLELTAPEHLELFSRYAQVMFREKVTGDEVGMGRLQRYDRAAAEAIQSLRGDRMVSFHTEYR